MEILRAPQQPVSVLEWDGSVKSVYHGEMWEGGVALSPVFLWEAWVMVGGSMSGYWVSEGHGGSHAILAGFSGFAPSGNVYNGSTNVSYSGDYTAQTGEWLHYAVGGDGTNLYVLINGVPVAKTALTARQAQYGPLLIGGSDHSNFLGRIASVRGYEGRLPTERPYVGTLWSGLQVERHQADPGTGWSQTPCQFACDYTTPGAGYPDLSGGFRGQLHHGRPYYGSGVGGSALRSGGGGAPVRVVDPTAPFGTQLDVARTRTFPSPSAVPGGAKIYDSFGRADSLKVYSATQSLGSTEGGSLGVLAWTPQAANHWGIFDGAAVNFNQFSLARVTADLPDVDVRVGRSLTAPSNYVGLSWRVNTAASSGYRAWLSGSNIQVERSDGSTLASWSQNNGTWTHLRIVTSGTAVTGYTGTSITGPWTQIGTTTDGSPANASEVGVGLYCYYGYGAMWRATEFGAF